MKYLIAFVLVVAVLGIAFLIRWLKAKKEVQAMDAYQSRMKNTAVIEASAMIIDRDYIAFAAELDSFRTRIEGREPQQLTPAERHEARGLRETAIDLRDRSINVLSRLSKEHNLSAHGIHVYQKSLNNVNSNSARVAINLDMFNILVEKLEKPGA